LKIYFCHYRITREELYLNFLLKGLKQIIENYFISRIRNPDDYKDFVQITLIKVWKNLIIGGKIKDGEQFEKYLWKFLNWKHKDYLRKVKNSKKGELRWA